MKMSASRQLLVCLTALAPMISATASLPRTWRAAHIMIGSEADLDTLGASIPGLAQTGLNVVIPEVDYNFDFKSRPEMAAKSGVTFDGARAFSKICRQYHVSIIPEINCLGHQSWEATTESLLRIHPELDETPGMYPNNKGIYCRSWCPLNPDLPTIIYPMIDEMIDAFQADGFHVGMDEVFIIGDDACPRCKGKDRGELFAHQVNDFHKHLKSKKVQMVMWADRLLDGKATGYGEWEASENGTDKAIDLIPKDIILCDWHYDFRTDYPSLKILTDHGFRVLPTTWKDPKAATAFAAQAKAMKSRKVLGVVSSNWGEVGSDRLATWPAYLASLAEWK